MPKPSWNNVMWGKQASFLPITFSDREIIDISSLHDGLDVLKSIYSKLLDLDAKDREYNSTYASSGVSLSSIHSSNRFKEEAPFLWDEFEEIASDLIENGNPLNSVKVKSA